MPKGKSIWTKDLLLETRFGQFLSPILFVGIILLVSYQAFSGLILDKAIVIGKYGANYTYEGANANLFGLAYLSVLLFFLPVPFLEKLNRIGMYFLPRVFMLLMCLSFIVSLSVAMYREAF